MTNRHRYSLRAVVAWPLVLLWISLLLVPLTLGVVLSLGRLRPLLLRFAMPAFARPALWLLGVEVEVVGLAHIQDRRPRVLVLNHSSVLDLFLFSGLNPPAPCPVAKAEFRWIPILNLAFWAAGAIFLVRGDRQKAVESLRRGAERLCAMRGTAMISPEGTRSKDGRLGPFKHGPFHLSKQAQAEIVPVVIRGAWDLCPPGTLAVRPGRVRIELHPPWPPSTDPAADALSLHEAYRGWLAADPSARGS